MEEDDIIILSSYSDSEIEVIAISSNDDAEGFETRPRCAGKPERKVRRKKNPATSKRRLTMTCIRDKGKMQRKHELVKGKTWSQCKKEREDQKLAPSACKRPKLMFPDRKLLTPLVSKCKDIISDGEFSDELPDLDDHKNKPGPDNTRHGQLPVNSSPNVIDISDCDSSEYNSNVKSLSCPVVGSAFTPSFSDELKADCRCTNDNLELPKIKAGGKKESYHFTKEHKQRFAAILGQVIKGNRESTSDSVSSLSRSSVSSVGSKNNEDSNLKNHRHFMDVLIPSNYCWTESPTPSRASFDDDYHVLSDLDGFESSVSEDLHTFSEDDSTFESTNSDIEEIEDTSLMLTLNSVVKRSNSFPNERSSESRPLRRVNVKKTFGEACTSTSKQLNLLRYFVPKIKDKLDIVQNRKNKFINLEPTQDPMFPKNLVDEESLALSLSQMHIHTIEAALEEGEEFFDYGLDLVSDFVSKFRPTDTLLHEVITQGLLGSNSVSVAFKSYRLVSAIWQKYPSLIRLDWDVLVRTMSNLTINKSLSTASSEFIKGNLFLQLVVQALEVDLGTSSLSTLAEIRKTLAFKFLSADCAFSNLKQIVNWIECVLTSGEYEELRDPRLKQQLNSGAFKMHPCFSSAQCDQQGSPVSVHEIPKLLPNFQKLLEIGVDISNSCIDAAKRIAGELVRTYIYLPEVKHKKLLLQSISSKLLQFKVVQRVLEDYCDGTILCCEDYPVSLKQIVEAYFVALPPKSPVTPPQSPSDDEENMSDIPVSMQFSAASCEELALLVYTVTQAYQNCAKQNGHQPLMQRIRQAKMNKGEFWSSKQTESECLSEGINDFHGHLVGLAPELNAATHQYLVMMQCLAVCVN